MRRDRSVSISIADFLPKKAMAAGILCLAVTSAIICSGCRQGGFLSPPGPILQQQADAIIHDPFPENDIGPTELASRPLGYQRPIPEAVRNRVVRDSNYGFGR